MSLRDVAVAAGFEPAEIGVNPVSFGIADGAKVLMRVVRASFKLLAKLATSKKSVMGKAKPKGTPGALNSSGDFLFDRCVPIMNSIAQYKVINGLLDR